MQKTKLALLMIVLLIVQLAFAFSTEPESKTIGFRDVKEKAAAKGKALSSFAEEKIDPEVLSSGSDAVDVIVEAEDVKGVHALETKKLGMGNFYSMRISKSEIPKLEKSDSVKKVWLEKTYRPLLDVAAPLINASYFYDSGYNGSGIKVCIIDTGVNSSHPALSPRVVAEKDFVTTDSDGDNPMDSDGHGTHVAGIVASADAVYRGIAPGASILNAKVFSSGGGAPESKIMSAMDWCIEQGADILTMSLGGPENPSDGSDALSQYADAAAEMGKVVTIAAGNSGPGGDSDCRASGDGSSYSVCSPGLARRAITVGSTKSGKSLPADAISSFSSRGPTSDGRTKPDVTAPGEWITSSVPTGYGSKSGTSMATPMVAGLAALILQARNMAPAELKALIMNTAVDLGTQGKDNAYGAGRVDGRVFAEIDNTLTGVINEYKVHNVFVNGSEIRATLYWPENSSRHNDVDLYLLDPAGNVRASSISQYNTDEIVSIQDASPSGYWHLLVDPYDVIGNQSYAIASSSKLSGQMNIRINNASNVVYHQINASNGNITLNLDWNSAGVNLDLYLYNTTGSMVNHSVSNSTNYETVAYNNAESGVWLARIVNLNGSVQYALSSSSPAAEQIIDNISPSVMLSAPANATYNTSNITVTFAAADDMSAFIDCNVSVNESVRSATIRNNSLAYADFSVPDGSYNVTVTCADWSYNRGNATVYFSVNATPPASISPMTSYPVVTFTGGNGSVFSPNGDGAFDSIAFNITVSENVSFGTIYLIAQNESKVKRFTTPVDTNPLFREWNGSCVSYCGSNATPVAPDGVYTIELHTTNASGNETVTKLTETITVDTAPMGIYFTGITPNNETLANNSVTINVTTGEAPSSLLLNWNGANLTMEGNGTSWSRTFNSLYGNYTFRVYARDSVYNWNASETRWMYMNHTINAAQLMDRLNHLANRSITVMLLNSSGGLSDNMLIPTERYTLRFNASGVLVEMADFLGMNLNTSATADIVKNITGESNLSSAFEQTGGTLESYVWIELNKTLPEGNFTPRIRFPLRKLYFYLNGTKDAPNSLRITDACNSNASNVPCYNASATEAVLYLSSFSGAAAGNDTKAPALNVNSPAETTYASASVAVNYTVNDSVAVDKCWYNLNNNANVPLNNCSNSTITAPEGSNTLRIYANDTSGNENQTTITFTVSLPAPTPAPVPDASSSSSTSNTGGSSTPSVPAAPTPTPSGTTNALKVTDKNNNTQTQGNSTHAQADTTGESPATGLVLLSPGNVAAGLAVIASVIAGAMLWKFRAKPKKKVPVKRK